MTCNGCANLIGKGCGKYGGRTPPEGRAEKCKHRDVPTDYVEPERGDCPHIIDKDWCSFTPSVESCKNWFTQNSEGKWVKDRIKKRMVPSWLSRKTMCRADQC